MAFEIKICGLTTLEDARHALACGADYLGFVLYSRSPRAITADALAAICAELPPEALAVGVFVNHSPEDVREIVERCGLHAAQIHGDEEHEPYGALPVPLWRAVNCAKTPPHPDPSTWPARRYILDAAPPGEYGGTGMQGDWGAAHTLCTQHPCMLAGGLHAENVSEAIQTVRPMGVDVSSGVEARHGKKDPDRVAAFIRNARAAIEQVNES